MQPILTLDDTDYEKKIAASKSAFENYSFLFFHINETDRIYDNHDFGDLVEEGEEIDDHALRTFTDRSPRSLAMAVTCAPIRSPLNGRITGDPVPITFWGRGIRQGTVNHFNESSCAYGEIGRIKGDTVIPTLLDLLGLSKKYGIISG
jgi:2,3-bisphosphoglycerate-independent phosphoglycerate mutase